MTPNGLFQTISELKNISGLHQTAPSTIYVYIYIYIYTYIYTFIHIHKPTDTHQFLDPSSSHPYLCKKGIPYNQALILKRICSDNESFDKCCNDLEGWLMERGYNG